MKRSNIIEARRKQVNPLVRQNVDLSFQIVDRIHDLTSSMRHPVSFEVKGR